MNRIRTYFLWLILSSSISALAQPVQTVTLGAPFSFSLPMKTGSVAPEVGTTLGGFEILKVSQAANGYNLLLVAYDTGSYKLPGTNGDIGISVMAPPPASIQDYAPPKEPEFLRAEADFPIWIPLLVTALVLLGALIFWLRNRKSPVSPTFAIQVPGGMSLLQEVKEGWLAGKLNSLQLGEGLVSSLQAQFGMPVKRSTLQLLREIRNRYPEACTPEVETVLRNTDAWRFGKQAASGSDGKSAIGSLEGLFLFTTKQKVQNN